MDRTVRFRSLAHTFRVHPPSKKPNKSSPFIQAARELLKQLRNGQDVQLLKSQLDALQSAAEKIGAHAQHLESMQNIVWFIAEKCIKVKKLNFFEFWIEIFLKGGTKKCRAKKIGKKTSGNYKKSVRFKENIWFLKYSFDRLNPESFSTPSSFKIHTPVIHHADSNSDTESLEDKQRPLQNLK